jgi:hypothetical protein
MAAPDASIRTAKFADLWDAWPVASPKDLEKRLGGSLPVALENQDTDTALRLSVAFNECGHPVGISTIHSGTVIKDGEGRAVITDPAEFQKLLEKKFGKPRHVSGEASIEGRKGILYFDHPASLKKSLGHLDLWDGTTTKSVSDYFRESKNVWLYELPHE